MGKKLLTITFVILLISLIIPTINSQQAMVGIADQQDNSVDLPVNNGNDDITDGTNGDKDQNSNANPSEAQTENSDDQQKNTIPKVEVKKYYVDVNYYLKPVNPDDSKNVVLLTFDDAPQGRYTEDILNTLDKYNAKAIFFVNGIYAEKHPDLLKEIHDKGHIIGNHTWWHKYLSKLDKKTTRDEIKSVNDFVESVIGERPKFFRPPYGQLTDYAKTIINEEQMQSMNWSLGAKDWVFVNSNEADKVVSQVLDNIQPGSNILMHDKHVTSIALDKILSGLKEKGYTFVLPTEVKFN